nr:MAG TPA: hypothetical protein [Caudoviricetes sp.]
MESLILSPLCSSANCGAAFLCVCTNVNFVRIKYCKTHEVNV